MSRDSLSRLLSDISVDTKLRERLVENAEDVAGEYDLEDHELALVKSGHQMAMRAYLNDELDMDQLDKISGGVDIVNDVDTDIVTGTTDTDVDVDVDVDTDAFS